MNPKAVGLTHPFEPVWDSRSRLLILGSFPSAASREVGFYYGHPRNRFWQMLEVVFEQPVPMDRSGRIGFLLHHRLALWDALSSCEVVGSSDASIRNAVPNDLASILDAAPIARVLANGQLAGRAAKAALPPRFASYLTVLPSTSPANAAWPLARLSAAWRSALLEG